MKILRDTLNISDELHDKLESEIRGDADQMDAPAIIAPDDMNILIQESKKPKLEKTTSMPISDVLESSKKPKSKKIVQMKIKKFVTLAKEKYKHKNYPEALKYLTKGLEADPKNQEILFFIKKVNMKLKRPGKRKKRKKVNKNKDQALEEQKTKIDSEVNIKEKITTPRSAHKKVEPKTAVAIGDLNGASLSSSSVDVLEKAQDTSDPDSRTQSVPKSTPGAEPELKLEKHVTEQDEDKKAAEKLKKITLNTPEKPKCISCNGTGSCYWCSGSGNCDRCGGSGEYNGEQCEMCNGSGKCNSCAGNGYCMWCRGKGTSKQMNTLYSKEK